MAAQHVFDFRQRDAHAADLHIAVHPGGEHDVAVRPVVALIAGAKSAQRLPIRPFEGNEIVLLQLPCSG